MGAGGPELGELVEGCEDEPSLAGPELSPPPPLPPPSVTVEESVWVLDPLDPLDPLEGGLPWLPLEDGG